MESQLTVPIPLSLADKLEQGDLVRTRPYDRVRELLGSIESGIPDLGQNHRKHLLQRLKGARPA